MYLVIKGKITHDRLLTRVFNPLPVQAAAEAVFGEALPAEVIDTSGPVLLMPWKGFRTEDFLFTYWNQCPSASFLCAVKLRNRSSRNILFAMSYGCDGSEGRHMTGLQSAMLRSKQLRRLIHCYSLEGDFCLVVDLKLSF